MFTSIFFLKRERPETDDFVIKILNGFVGKILRSRIFISSRNHKKTPYKNV